MMKVIAGTLMLYFCLCMGDALAAEVTWFGPKQYVRTQGKPDQYTDSFQARAGAARIIILNGDENGDSRISSARITLNGTPLFGPKDFNQHVGHLSADISLEAENILLVELKSKPGRHGKKDHKREHHEHAGRIRRILRWMYHAPANLWAKCGFGSHHKPPVPDGPYLTITIIQDVPPPEAVLSADPPTILTGLSTTLTWSCTEAETCIIEPGIGQVDLSGSMQISPAESTTYILTATGPGGTVSEQISVIVEPPALSIKITHPADGTETQSRILTVSGTVSMPEANVFVNGAPALVTGDLFVAENILLNIGANTVVATATSGSLSAEDTISVSVPDIDLEPYYLELVDLDADQRNLKVQGRARVTIVNRGAVDVTRPYHLALFEDADLNSQFDPAVDNLLANVEVPSGPAAGGSKDVLVDFMGQSLFRDNHMHVYVDHRDAIEESNEENNRLSVQHGGIDVSASYLRVDNSLCPDQALLQVRIGNPGTAEVATALPVSFYSGDPQSAGVLIGTVYTTQPLFPGAYQDLTLQWPQPASEQPLFAVADDDGSGHGIHVESDEENNRTYTDLSACIGPQVAANSISGLAVDALTGSVLGGTLVSLYTDQDGAPGTLVQQIITPAGGSFIFSDLVPGDYILNAALDGYLDGRKRVRLNPDETRDHRNLVLSPLLEPDEIRIVLTWGQDPQDLEAHLTGPSPTGCRHHCYYWNRQIPGAVLDKDDTDGFGPETITLTQGTQGTYRYYVHDFTNRSTQSAAMSGSGAQVVVYFGSGSEPLIFEVPPEAGTVWHVFDIDGQNGQVTPIDRMSFQSEPGKIDFPVITSTPATYMPWGTAYTYQLVARDPDPDPLTWTLLKAPSGMMLDARTGVLHWNPGAGQSGSHEIAVRVSDGRCGEDTQSFNLVVSYQPMASLQVTPESGYNPGGQIHLAWTTQRADTITIDQGIGEVAASGSLTIDSPATPVAYTLTASNTLGQATDTAPKPPIPQIEVCNSQDSRTLSWSAVRAVTCSIAPDIGEVPCSGSLSVDIGGPDEYTLTASNGAGATGAKQKAGECGDMLVVGFSATEVCDWTPGEPITLELKDPQGAELCEIDHGIGIVPCDGAVQVAPTEPTTYTLTATGGQNSITRTLTVPQIRPLEAYLHADRPAIYPGDRITLSWNAECAQSSTIDQGIGEVAAIGSLVTAPDVLPKTYTLTAMRGAETKTDTVTIAYARPGVSFYAAPGIVKVGESATLVWSVDHAETCRIDPDIGPVDPSGSIAVQPSRRTTYTLTAEGPGGTAIGHATVSFIKPTVQIQADPEVLLPGQSATLTWIYTNADTCRIDPEIGDVPLGGSLVVTPDKSTTYTITATGPGGTVTDSVTVSFFAPTVSISAEPAGVGPGQSTTLTWTSTLADTCTILPDIGAVDPNGSTTVAPPISTTYTITATGPGGIVTDSVTVDCLEPVITFGPALQAIQLGEIATLAWDVPNAQIVWIDPLGQMPASGTVPVSPTRTTRYTLRTSGCGRTHTAEATVEVSCPPSLSLLQPDGVDDRANTSFLLQWTDADCDSDAAIALYYDTDSNGADGVLIADGLTEDADGGNDRLVWDTSALPEGEYFVYAVIDDGQHAPVTIYADHPVVIDHSAPPLARITLAAHDAAAGDRFGAGVAISDHFAFVGAPAKDQDSGAVYVFERRGSDWIETAKLAAGDSTPGQSFGHSVAVEGDTIIVGSGEAAYIFILQDGQWTQQAVLYPVAPEPNMDFGRAVALDGQTAYIGAPRANSVFVFARSGESWTQQQILIPGDIGGYSYLGSSISADGGDVLVGTHRLIVSFGIEGAYVFTPYFGSLTESAKLMGSDSKTYDLFGWAVSIDGDNAIVGSLLGADQGGAAYIFRRSENGWDWQETSKLVPDNAMSNNNFGVSVLISNDYAYVGTGDHEGIILSQNASEAVYLFRNQGGAWTQQLKLDNGDNAPLVGFGETIAAADGYLMVGAQNDSRNGLDTGLVFIYPTCSADLEICPAAVEPGATATLSWSSNLADTCRIEPDIGTVAPSGSMTVSPAATTTYTIHAAGPYGQTTEQITLWVGSQPPTVSLTATPPSIVAGQSTTLAWDSTFASDVSIEPGIGLVAARGTLAVAPLQTTTYTIFATGPGGTAQAHVEVGVTVYAPTAGIEIAPASVTRGESATLTWATTHATSVIIEPGIGTVEADGSLQVSPDETTTYTLTALGPGGIRTQEVVLTVVDPQPTVGITVEPEQILSGQSAQLTWVADHADTCTIEPDIGPVGLSGSLSVSPATSTTYIITASGSGGTATATARITVNAATPQITFGADPAAIVPGDTATLSWSVTGADAVSIDNAIGAVAAEGSAAVTPEVTTTYTLTAAGPGGTATAATTVSVATPITIMVVAPSAGDVIDRTDTLVRGIFTNSSGAETGISVNGVPALVYGNQFAANHVPLVQGENTLSVLAADSQGHKAVRHVTVQAETTGQSCTAIVLPEAGLAPYSGELRIDAPMELSTTDLQVYGPGGVEVGDGSPAQYPLTISQPGIHRLVVEATDFDARLYTDQVAVLVYDPGQLDALLQAKWNNMKSRLAAGDIEGALQDFDPNARPLYEYNFNALQDHLGEVLAGMESVTLVKATDRLAEYNLVGEQNGQQFSFYLVFEKDGYGIWRIRFF